MQREDKRTLESNGKEWSETTVAAAEKDEFLAEEGMEGGYVNDAQVN